MRRRVVITGMGMITPLGHSVEDTWSALRAGRTGTGPITSFEASGYPSRVAGEVKHFDPTDYMDRKEAKRADRFSQFAIVAAQEALAQANLHFAAEDGERVAVVIGTAHGGIASLLAEYDVLRAKGPGRVSPFVMPMALADMAGGAVSIKFGAKAVNYSLVSACASGADSIGQAAAIIRRGDADIALAGGAEAPITRLTVAGYCAARALGTMNDEPEHASRPFDRRRNGFIIAEGSGILVLEDEQHARARGALILAELAGYGATSDAFHLTQLAEDGEGAARAMRMALDDAGLRPVDIHYLNAHGTSTPLNDRVETLAIKRVFAEDAARHLPVSSTKSMMGHLLGAAGAVEAIVSVLAIRDGIIPPTANYEVADPDCDLDYVPNVARPLSADTVMSNSLGFGGHNASLVIRRGQDPRAHCVHPASSASHP